MSTIANYTLFYNAEDGKLHAGSCREENEALVDVSVGEVVDISGYRGEGKRLVLTGLTFETSADIALVVPADTTIVLESGVSTLKVDPTSPTANVAILYVKGDLTITGGEGKLICDASCTKAENCSWSRGICVRYADLTVTGGELEVYCGDCNVRAGALYAGGRLFSSENGESENGAITITGGRVTAAAVPHTIRATNTKLTIGPNSIIENSNEFAGGAETFHGDYLAQADPAKPVVICFQP
jgi:hypothetical protein